MSRDRPTLAGSSRPRAPDYEGLALKPAQTLSDKLDQKVFTAIYSRSLVYNTCWEDPAVDRQALRLTPSDTVLAITSAGCNVLDYALVGPHRIHAVDANPRQTALLELKLAGIRRLDFEDFFRIFGHGRHDRFRELFAKRLRDELTPFARDYWERRVHWFEGRNASFYYHGLSGVVARLFQSYLRLRPRLGAAVSALFDTRCLDDQRHIYDKHIRPFMWSAGMNWTLSRQITMSMLGVPMPQRREVMAQHAGGVPGFVREAIEYVFRFLPVWTNYFWAVYLRGRYSQTCCPEYLKPDNFAALKGGLAERIQPHSCTVTEFLHGTDERISKYVLLDHMDWMSCYYPEALVEEWEAILAHATPDARIIFRSAHARPAYLDSIAVGSARLRLREALRFDDDLARELTRDDRVHTYAGFHIADVRA